MMSLGLEQDKEVVVSADGADEVSAVEELAGYLQKAQ